MTETLRSTSHRNRGDEKSRQRDRNAGSSENAMKIEEFAKQMEPKEILTGVALQTYRNEMECFLSDHATKEQLISEVKALYMSVLFKSDLIRSLNAKIDSLKSELADVHSASLPPVVEPDVCGQCGKVVSQANTGRKKKYCSDACRMKFKRSQ